LGNPFFDFLYETIVEFEYQSENNFYTRRLLKMKPKTGLIFNSIMILSFFSIFICMSYAMGGNCGGGMGGGGGCCGGGVIDPPPGAAFKDLVEISNLSTQPGVVNVNLEVKKATVNINGTNANLMTYNGIFPGPVIRVKKGDILNINFKNSLPHTTDKNFLNYEKNHTNLHTHGWHVSPEEPSDAAHLDIPAGGTYQYQYDLSKLEPGALSFYHGHFHGLSAEQYWAGMIGVLEAEDETNLLTSYETHIMILKDISLSGSDPVPHSMMMDYMQGKEGNIIMVNGQVNPVLSTKPGQVLRLRILNGSNARFYKLSLAGHTLQLIGTDGGLLDKPYPVTELLLAPGERADVLVKTSQTTGNYKLLSLPYSKHGNMQSAQITLLTLVSGGTTVNQTIPSTINPKARRLNMNTGSLPQRTFTLSMGQGDAYINGQDYDVNPYMTMSQLGTYEVWEIINNSGMDHPFHQHINPAQILSINGGDSGYASLYTQIPAWKDTVLVPKGGSVTMLVPIMDYPGMAMFHCHIMEHEDIGMMGMWHIMPMM
jgi:FtsP/CotA-like multicopper oxidase with cupredoxin domain